MLPRLASRSLCHLVRTGRGDHALPLSIARALHNVPIERSAIARGQTQTHSDTQCEGILLDRIKRTQQQQQKKNHQKNQVFLRGCFQGSSPSRWAVAAPVDVRPASLTQTRPDVLTDCCDLCQRETWRGVVHANIIPLCVRPFKVPVLPVQCQRVWLPSCLPVCVCFVFLLLLYVHPVPRDPFER